jgi:hypothetical protein
MLVALGIITGALMALLGAFITSAASVQTQQAQSKALRVALDRNESMRQTLYADVPVGTTNSSLTSPEGIVYTYKTVVEVVDSQPDADVLGDTVKRITTTVSWTGRNGKPRSVTSSTAVAPESREVALDARYNQAIKSVSTDPNPSVGVDYDGLSTEAVRVQVVMSGFLAGDVVVVRWKDTDGTRLVTRHASSTDGRNWQLVIPAGDIFWQIPTGVSRDVVFEAEAPTGLKAQTKLVLWGPVVNPPVITSWNASSSPISVFNRGKSAGENKVSITFTCDITGLEVSPAKPDIVKMAYLGEAGTRTELTLTRVSGTTRWTYTFAASSTFFNIGANQPFTCIVRRGSDGGPASNLRPITVAT